MPLLQRIIAKLTEGRDLSREEARTAMTEIMSGGGSDAQIAAFLVAMRLKGETVEEITGCAEAMRDKAAKVHTKHPTVIDTCGTGGDATGTFNVSTAAAIVAAGAGAIVAKHGNRAVSSKCGSADVLKAVGVNTDGADVKGIERCLDEIGIAFLFAPLLHGAMKHAAPVRRELGIRTIFNILGPLTNPAGATRQLLGVYDEALTPMLAQVLRELGAVHALVVHGAGGLDEISTCGPTTVSEVRGGEVKTYRLNPEEFGLERASAADLAGGDAVENSAILRDVLEGKRGPRRDIVALNAGAALHVAGLASSVKEGVEMAMDSIDRGAAKAKLDELIRMSNA
jgi:anthranilate phosphoribosyltransferase